MNLNKLQQYKEQIKELGATPLSFSKANLITQCPQRYYRKYIVKEKIVDPVTGKYPRGEVGTVAGSFVHKVLENCLKHGHVAGLDSIDFLLEWANAVKKEKLLQAEIEYVEGMKDNTEKILGLVIGVIKKNGLKIFTELWFNNFVSPSMRQNYGKFTNGKGNLSNPDKFFQGASDLVLISNDGWGKLGLIIDYKTYLSDAHKSDIFSKLQMKLYSYFLFQGFSNLESIRCATAEIPSATIKDEGIYYRETFDDCEEEIFSFFDVFEKTLSLYTDLGLFPHTTNSFCSFCEFKLSCKRDAKFQCFNNKDNKMICGKDSARCYKNCINL